MEKIWWWKTSLIAVLVVLAILYLIPTLVGKDKVPDWYNDIIDSELSLGLDLRAAFIWFWVWKSKKR